MKNIIINTSSTDYKYYLGTAYGHIMSMRAECNKVNDVARAATLFSYANALQKKGYSAGKTENITVQHEYAAEMAEICVKANAFYAAV